VIGEKAECTPDAQVVARRNFGRYSWSDCDAMRSAQAHRCCLDALKVISTFVADKELGLSCLWWNTSRQTEVQNPFNPPMLFSFL